MSFDPEFMRLVETMGAEDTARKAEDTANAAEEQRVKALRDARNEEYRAKQRVREQEFLRKGRATLAMARTIGVLAAEKRVPQDIEIGYLAEAKGSRWRHQPPERVVQASGWRIEQTRVDSIRIPIPLKGLRAWIASLPNEYPEQYEAAEQYEVERQKREYTTVPGYSFGVLLTSTGELFHYRWNDDPQFSGGPAIVTTSMPSTSITEPRPSGRYDREAQEIWDYPRERYEHGGREAWAYPTEQYDRALARFAIDHTLLPQA